MKRCVFAALLALVCLLPAPLRAQSFWDSHFLARMGVIASHVDLLGVNRILLLGDSNTEMFWWGHNDGCNLVNAGFGGARIADIAARADALAALTMPRLVHVMIGTNNLVIDQASAEWSQMHSHLIAIATAFKSRGAVVVMWPVPPTAASFASVASRTAVNQAIASAANLSGSLWDWWWPETIAGGDGFAAIGALNGDGVHLSAASQISRYWRIATWRQYLGVNCG
jgi:lysophospholipase L1-like esterase